MDLLPKTVPAGDGSSLNKWENPNSPCIPQVFLHSYLVWTMHGKSLYIHSKLSWWKITCHVPWNSYAGPSLHKLATCAGWHHDYWKMSQVSEAFYCHCCQVGFSMTSQKCNGKKEWKKKNCSRPFADGWLVGWKSLHCLKKSFIRSKYWSYETRHSQTMAVH